MLLITNYNSVASNELFETIISYLAVVKDVEKIFFKKIDNMLCIWTVLSGYAEEQKRRAVYTQESLLMEYLANRKCRFDFFIIEPDEEEEIVSSGAVVIYSKKG